MEFFLSFYLSSKLTDLKIFFKYDSGMSFKMGVRFSNLNMIGIIRNMESVSSIQS